MVVEHAGASGVGNDGGLEGLMTVEVEFRSEEDYHKFKASSVPEWFGKEVTGDARYINQNLAMNGLPDSEV